MPFDNSDEIERLKQELEEVTAERDFLLSENRRLTKTAINNTASDRISGVNLLRIGYSSVSGTLTIWKWRSRLDILFRKCFCISSA
jgi:hypothetical protein